jgi:hypothetical protein
VTFCCFFFFFGLIADADCSVVALTTIDRIETSGEKTQVESRFSKDWYVFCFLCVGVAVVADNV